MDQKVPDRLAHVKREPKFCTRCGNPLAPREKVINYDPYTGEPNFDRSKACRNPCCCENPDNDW